MTATIHQPDFMPWFGFFRKIARSRTWILLDHTRNNPRDASFWGRRVRFLVGGKPHWISLPLVKDSNSGQGVPINEIRLNTADTRAFGKSKRTIQLAYANTPFFDEWFPVVEEYFDSDASLLIDRNMQFIRQVLKRLDLQTEVIASSSLDPVHSGTELLAELLLKAGADTYLCGTGAGGYQDDAILADAGIKINYNEFEHPVYDQGVSAPFIPGLSILDALFRVDSGVIRTWLLTG